MRLLRCFALFQEQDNGMDILVLVMYVQEYDTKCPPPNTAQVVISYLDTVPFLGPKR